MPPGVYFGTELTYTAMSLVSKLWLGVFLLWNVILVDGTIDENLSLNHNEPAGVS